MQLDMFTPCYVQEIQEELGKVRKSSEQVRRGLFARHTALQRDFDELRQRYEEQEREIYKLKRMLFNQDPEPVFKIV